MVVHACATPKETITIMATSAAPAGPNFKVWSAEECRDWVTRAANSRPYRGQKGNYHFHVIPKATSPDQVEDSRRTAMTEALGNLFYRTNPAYRVLSLGFYRSLMNKICTNRALQEHVQRDIMVVIEGSNATAIMCPNHNDVFKFSDLDIKIYINPYLEPRVFESIKHTIRTLVLQTMSQHKKMLDIMFFAENPDPNIKYMCMDEDTIQQFKKDHIAAMRANGFVSVFEDKEVRNFCSRNSFMLVNSDVYEDKVVRVETPHFENCERIPLRKSPVFCSTNATIQINGNHEDGQPYSRDFDLYRIKLNNMAVDATGEVRINFAYDNDDNIRLLIEPAVYEERIAADFIDVSIPNQMDSELMDFWSYGRAVFVRDDPTDQWIAVPDAVTCLRELYKLLNVYECPESKRPKRQLKYDTLKQLIAV